MINPDNKNTLLWLASEIQGYEEQKGHARIVIELVNGVCTHAESTKKVLCKNV